MNRIPTILLCLALAAPVAGQEPPKEEKPAAAESAVVVDLKGAVDVKRPGDKEWIEAAKNMTLPKGSEICTASESKATLLIDPNLTVELGAVTMVKVDELLKDPGKARADLKLKFGTVDLELKKGELKSDLKVSTPNATTSVSGSKGKLWGWASKGGGYFSLKVESGEWTKQFKGGGTQKLGPGEGSSDTGELKTDLHVKWGNKMFGDFGGRSKDELLGGDPMTPGLLPLYEGGGSSTNPFYDAFNLPAALPLPPPPPIP